MKYFFIIFAALVIILAGGAGAYYFFKTPAVASIGPDGAHQTAGEVKAASKPSTGFFVTLDPLILPIIDEHGVNQVVTMVVVIEVIDAAAMARVTNLEPRLKDAYIQELYGVLNRHAALKDGVLQVGMIKSRLNRISNRVVGDDIITDVLLQVVQQRPI